MGEYKGKMSGLINKISLQAQSRIMKVSKIQEKFQEKLISFTLQEPVKLDFSAYSSLDIARKEIFLNIFTIEKQRQVTDFASFSSSSSSSSSSFSATASISSSSSVTMKANVNF
jgi:hypothetical protein